MIVNDVDVLMFDYNFQLNDLMNRMILKKILNKFHHHYLIVHKMLMQHHNNMYHQDLLLNKDMLLVNQENFVSLKLDLPFTNDQYVRITEGEKKHI